MNRGRGLQFYPRKTHPIITSFPPGALPQQDDSAGGVFSKRLPAHREAVLGRGREGVLRSQTVLRSRRIIAQFVGNLGRAWTGIAVFLVIIYQPKISVSAQFNGETVGILLSCRFIGKGHTFYWDLYERVLESLSENDAFGILETVKLSDEETANLPRLVRSGRVQALLLIG